MTDTTPVQRAAEAIRPDLPHLVHGPAGTHTTARVALNAALDRDELAGIIGKSRDRARPGAWDYGRADAIIAHLLGSES